MATKNIPAITYGKTELRFVIYPIHTKVRGRARFRVGGLYRSEPLKRLLETQLSDRKGIFHASASTLTGNLLVLFDPKREPRKVAMLVQHIIEGAALQLENTHPIDSRIHAAQRSIRSQQPSSRKSRSALQAIEEIKRLFQSSEEPPEKPWHLLPRNSVITLVDTRTDRGLSRRDAISRLKRYGANILPESNPRSRWDIVISQLNSLPIYLLAAAATVSVLTGGLLDAAVIMGVVAANAAIGYVTESQAEKTIQSLNRFVRPATEVIREGQIKQISADEVVFGDLLVLKPGTYVAADSRLIRCNHLTVDESILTGESMPVFKSARALGTKNAPIADRINMAYMGTLVTGGEGLAVVVATSRHTEMGSLQVLLQETASPKTPIERQLSQIGDQLVLFCGAICGVVFLMGFLRGYGFLQMLRMSISLAAAAVPEGLPAAATINFALGIKHMRRHGVLIRHLQAMETLGAVQTVCLDKTGTITWNRISVLEIHSGMRRILTEDGRFILGNKPLDPLNSEEIRQLIYACTLCNETKVNGKQKDGRYQLYGSPTEIALIDLAIRAGVDVSALQKSYKALRIVHRAENRLFMGTVHRGPDGRKLFSLKGSPPEVMSMCTWQMKNDRVSPLTETEKLEIETENERMAGNALRVLGVACRTLEGDDEDNLENGLTWLGLVGMADPIRDGVKELIDIYHRAGIDTVMITGDQSPTAYAVARELNLSRDKPLEILDSTRLNGIDPELMQALAEKVQVYSRVSPAHKLKIVQALQAADKTVAMTGDGINDGPALKASDIGIAMGKSGTDVAREIADVVLEEDDLETLIIAVRDGRTTYQNIRKSVHFFLSTNFSEIMVMLAAMAMGIGFPLSVMQLLWINIISDIFPALALSMEPPEPDVLEQPPRDAKAPLFSASDYKDMTREAAAISAGALAAYGYGIGRYGLGAGAGSLAFQSLTIGQLLHAFSCRSERHSFFDEMKPPSNNYLNIAVGGSLLLQILTMVLPGLRRLLDIRPISLSDTAVIGGSALLPFALNEIQKKRRVMKNEKPFHDDL